MKSEKYREIEDFIEVNYVGNDKRMIFEVQEKFGIDRGAAFKLVKDFAANEKKEEEND